MIKKLFVLILLSGLSVFFFQLVRSYDEKGSLNETASYYAEQGAQEIGAVNLVTAIVVTYRGLDTLGEVTILFLTAAIVALLLKTREQKPERKVGKTGEILETASMFLFPLVITLGVYVFINGHLTPGGGFQGGAILASGLVLLLLANPVKNVQTRIFTFVESLSGITYVGIGLAGLFLAGGFLDSRILPLGQFGTLLSAGVIPVIYILIGLKVGSELSGILTQFQKKQGDE